MRYLRLSLLILLLPTGARAQGIISTVVGNGQVGNGADGIVSTSTHISQEAGKMLIAPNGDMIFADNNRIRKVDGSTGIVTTIAGSLNSGFDGDGGPATDALFNNIKYIAFDKQGDLFLADRRNHRIRKIDMQTGIVTTVAGNGVAASYGDGNLATLAALNHPTCVAFDTNNVMLINEAMGYRVREVYHGYIKTIAGTGTPGNYGDGGLSPLATLYGNNSLAVDSANNIYISCYFPHKIRKIDAATSVITTIAGAGQGYSGDGGPALNASMSGIGDLVTDKAGNIYLSDVFNSVIRKIDGNGIITTIAGTGMDGYNGENVTALAAEMHSPIYLTLDSCGNLYVSDSENHRIRKVTYGNCSSLTVRNVEKKNRILSVYPNPASNELTLSSLDNIDSLVIVDVTGRIVIQRTVNRAQVTLDVTGLARGVYFVRVNEDVEKFVRE